MDMDGGAEEAAADADAGGAADAAMREGKRPALGKPRAAGSKVSVKASARKAKKAAKKGGSGGGMALD